MDLEVGVAGNVFRQSFPPLANQSLQFVWDGNDAYGRPTQGGQIATVKVTKNYPLPAETRRARSTATEALRPRRA